MSKVTELYSHSTERQDEAWGRIVEEQYCPFMGKKCFKVRKSDPQISIGTCSVLHSQPLEPVIICPARLTERRQIFIDCFHLLTTHEPGNELHIIPEVAIPGGNVDYFLVSVKNRKVKDFVGIEIQAIDTTGTVWQERQQLLRELGISINEEHFEKSYGMNWKMTAKTILVQMHHKIDTFQNVNKKLVLVIQDKLLFYMNHEFNFTHLRKPAALGDSMHFHAYHLGKQPDNSYRLEMHSRMSTDAEGIGLCLGLQAEAKVELEQIHRLLESKLSQSTLFNPV